jgi:hypothetical protein
MVKNFLCISFLFMMFLLSISNAFASYGDFWCMRNEEKAAHPLL